MPQTSKQPLNEWINIQLCLWKFVNRHTFSYYNYFIGTQPVKVRVKNAPFCRLFITILLRTWLTGLTIVVAKRMNPSAKSSHVSRYRLSVPSLGHRVSRIVLVLGGERLQGAWRQWRECVLTWLDVSPFSLIF